jgi:hypothetical protein
MKSITKSSRRRRMRVAHRTVSSQGKGVNVKYACPKDPNDQRRWGKELKIVGENYSITLDGRGINAIKSVLERAGELG